MLFFAKMYLFLLCGISIQIVSFCARISSIRVLFHQQQQQNFFFSWIRFVFSK